MLQKSETRSSSFFSENQTYKEMNIEKKKNRKESSDYHPQSHPKEGHLVVDLKRFVQLWLFSPAVETENFSSWHGQWRTYMKREEEGGAKMGIKVYWFCGKDSSSYP